MINFEKLDTTNATSNAIKYINETAQTDFEGAKNMLMLFNMVFDTKYGWFNQRVAVFDDPDAESCEKYKNVHDAYLMAYIEENGLFA